MTKPTKTLEQKVAIKAKEANRINAELAALREKVQAKKEANKPKSIIDRVKTFSDVLKLSKPSKEALAIVNYSGKDNNLEFCRDFLKISLIAKVLNEGWIPKRGEQRWYAWFDVSSGFVFCNTLCDDSDALTASASRLCFKTEKLAEYAGIVFLTEHRKAIHDFH